MVKKLDGKNKNHFFWTLPQHKLLNNHSEAINRMVMMADFGTGKTSLLFEKAARLLQLNKSVVVVIFEVGTTSTGKESLASKKSMSESLLTTQYRLKLKKVAKESNGAYEVFGLPAKGKVCTFLVKQLQLGTAAYSSEFMNIL